MTTKQNDYSDARQQRAGGCLVEFDAIAQGWRPTEMELVGFSVRCPRAEGDDYLMTIRALDAEGQPCVSFHGSYNLLELWVGAWQRWKSGTLRWKADEWGR